MKASKPHKRRTQAIAEKGVDAIRYVWQELLDSYVFEPLPEVRAHLTEHDGSWEMRVVINGQKFHGERSTLEEAFKATANLLFKHAKDIWLRMDTRAVIAPWSTTVPEE